MSLDIAALALAFAGRLRAADREAFTEVQAAAYAEALQADMPRSRRDLYSVSRDIFLSGRQYLDLFNREFAEVFGAHGGTDALPEPAARRADGRRRDALAARPDVSRWRLPGGGLQRDPNLIQIS